MWPLRLVKAYSSDSFTSTMTATKRLLLLVAGAALVTFLSRFDGFCVHSTSANFSEVKNLSCSVPCLWSATLTMIHYSI
jgi:hypothetical protein